MNVNIKGAASLGQENVGLLDARDPEKIARGMPLNFLPEPEDMTGSYVLLPSRQNNRPLTGFFFTSRRRHTRFSRDWSSDVCSSDLRSSTKSSISSAADGARIPTENVRQASCATQIGRASCRERVYISAGAV